MSSNPPAQSARESKRYKGVPIPDLVLSDWYTPLGSAWRNGVDAGMAQMLKEGFRAR